MQRLLRVVLPVDLIDRVDQVVDGGFGYADLNAFVTDAIEQRLLELEHSGAQRAEGDVPAMAMAPGPLKRNLAPRVAIKSPALDLSETALRAPAPGALAPDGAYEVRDEPLFGVHNRDYPTLWAAQLLCEWTLDAVLPLSRFHARIKDAGIQYRAALELLEDEVGAKLTALFPKPSGSAGETFRAYAVGNATRGSQGVRMAGPFYAWSLARAWEERRRLVIAPTADCYELLTALEGMTVVPPHEEHHAWTFWSHVRRHAPTDFRGLETLLRVSANEPNRRELVQAFTELAGSDSENVVRSVAQGYVSRAREWGFLENDLRDGRYALTEIGARFAAEVGAMH